jgi:hypothetical protein
MTRNQTDLGEPRYVAVTSIPPPRAGDSGDARRRHIARSIASFQASGFKVVSINRAAEAASLGHLYPSVSIEQSDKFDGLFKDRYGPSFAAIFEVCRGAGFCGIINADVYLLRSEITRVLAENPDTFFVARRLDVADQGSELLGAYRRGIDAVFFNPVRFAAVLDDEGLGRFQLGASLWDIVLPTLASLQGEVRFIEPPFILHSVHKPRWSRQDYKLLKTTAVNTIVDHARRHAGTSRRAAEFLKIVEERVGRHAIRSRGDARTIVEITGTWLRRIESASTARVDINPEDPAYAGVRGMILQPGAACAPPSRLRGFGKFLAGLMRR